MSDMGGMNGPMGVPMGCGTPMSAPMGMSLPVGDDRFMPMGSGAPMHQMGPGTPMGCGTPMGNGMGQMQPMGAGAQMQQMGPLGPSPMGGDTPMGGGPMQMGAPMNRFGFSRDIPATPQRAETSRPPMQFPGTPESPSDLDPVLDTGGRFEFKVQDQKPLAKKWADVESDEELPP